MIPRALILFCLLSPLMILPAARAVDPVIQSLAGDWQVRLDPNNTGIKDNWAAAPLAGATTARLPGSLTTNNLGNDITVDTPWMGGGLERGGFKTAARYAPYRQPGNIKIPFWLQPIKYYKGMAWYQRGITVPEGWRDKPVRLTLERCHWGSTVWIDDRMVGSADSLSTPHRYEFGILAPGAHRLTIRIDNNYLIRVGPDASSITDHTQTNWNGIIGGITLSAHAPVAIGSQQVFPRNDGTVTIKLGLHNHGATTVQCPVSVAIIDQSTGKTIGSTTTTVQAAAGKSDPQITLKTSSAPALWSEFSPRLHSASTSVGNETIATRFGFREIRADGRTIMVNDVPVFLRGNLDCGAFPLTGHPSTDRAEWLRIFKVYKAYGLNHARFHSWCPPEAAFAAADELGIFLQVECGVWRGTCGIKDAKPVEPFLYEEGERISREFGNHPSFVLFTHGNEPWELDQNKLSTEWVPAMKQLDCRHLVCAGAHYPVHANNDYHNIGPGGGMNLRYHGTFSTAPATDQSYEAMITKQSAPVISHEPGEWCVFPDLDEIAKYTGVMKARNLEIVRDFMRQNHLLGQTRDFLIASGKFQTLLYKEETEKFLRTRGLAGFQLLGLNDFPGQGTALVGVVDVFWHAKPYVSAAEYRSFSGPVVPWALMPKRVWTNDETFTARIQIAQYSGKPMANALPEWRIVDATGKEHAAGKLPAITIPVGNDNSPGTITMTLAPFTRATMLTLHVTLAGTAWQNSWNFWVYPAANNDNKSTNVLVCHTRDEAMAGLAKGASVLLLPARGQIIGSTHGSFQPIFWNKAWFPGQKEHTLGMCINNKHPALADFPTDSHADWQWWDLMNRSKPMVLDALPAGVRPIVQPIDDWNTCRRLGMVIEGKVGPGKLVIATCDLESDLAARPVARQLRASLLAYMGSPAFKPTGTLTADHLATLMTSGAGMRTITRIRATTEAPDYPAAQLIDGDPESFWHSAWQGNPGSYPHEIVIDLAAESKVSGMRLLPRQDGTPNGWVKDIEILTSTDGKSWTTVHQSALANNQEWKAVSFAPTAARFIKVRALTPHNASHAFASFAELEPAIHP